jgi:plastocyanin
MNRRVIGTMLAVLAVVAMVALTGCSGGGGAGGGYSTSGGNTTSNGTGAAGNTTGNATGSASGNSVSIKNFAFSPASLSVNTGTAVTWTNDDSTAHTVTADDGSFNGGPLEPGKTYSFTFTKAGTYKYHCSIHPQMVAEVVVK